MPRLSPPNPLHAAVVLALTLGDGAAQGAATTSFEPATPLRARDGAALRVPGHAAVRAVDWDQDGDLDLLVGGGDGQVWLLENRPTGSAPGMALDLPRALRAGARRRWGTGYTGAVLTDVTGDRLPDLLVAHSGDRLTIHANCGKRGAPAFADDGLEVPLQKGCQGRFDVADWDGDGLLDVVTGAFGGRVAWHQNIGRRRAPKFDADQPLGDIQVAYNAHPRVLDFDRDGRLDLLLGVNWGTFSLYRAGEDGLSKPEQLRSAADGKAIHLREENGDDTTPELVDVDGDGVLDLLSGGKNGRLFVLRGVGQRDRVAALLDLLESAGTPQWFEEHEAARDAAFAALGALQADLSAGLIQPRDRAKLFEALAPLPERFPELLRRRRFDLEETPHAPMLAAQFWVVLLEAVPPSKKDPRASRRRVADALGFEGGYRDLLVDLGVVFYDNDRASARQLERMRALLLALPQAVWDVELVSVAGWLGDGKKRHPVRARTGINIFAMDLGVPENSFPKDAPRPGITDVFLICLAHEVAHNMLDTVGRELRPELFERKFVGLQNAAGDAVVYRSPRARGLDMAATKEQFRARGLWDGDEASWRGAWHQYFDGIERFEKSYARGNCRFFLESPQEAFATLANQYVTDSDLMLMFSKARWDAGHRNVVNQFLLIADYLSNATLTSPTYRMQRGGALDTGVAQLTRDRQGRVTRFVTDQVVATFGYASAATGLVTKFGVKRKAAR